MKRKKIYPAGIGLRIKVQGRSPLITDPGTTLWENFRREYFRARIFNRRKKHYLCGGGNIKPDLMHTAYYPSPAGLIEIRASEEALTSVMFCDERRYETGGDSKIFSECVRQLEEYFNGQRFAFDLPMCPEGTDFRRRVRDALMQIPFGTTVSYSDLARAAGCPKAVRAAGAAGGKNKLWIIVPCHRVIGADGSLTGYAGGIERKRLLLAHEAQAARNTAGAKSTAHPALF